MGAHPFHRSWAAGVAAVTAVAALALAPDPARAIAATAPSSGSATATVTPGAFSALTPYRLLDTRVGTGSTRAPVAAGASLTLTVAGRGGVPSSGAAAVALNVTVTGPSRAGNVTVYPSGHSRPTASNLNFSAGQTIANLVLATLGPDGNVELSDNSSGTVNLVADVSGYYRSGSPTASGSYVPLTPYRAMDTRNATGVRAGVVPARGSVTLTVATGGTGRVPADAGTVALNVTATGATAAGVVTVYPSGQTRPTASNLNFGAGQTVPNLVVTKIGTAGQVTFYNNSPGTLNLVADVAGFFRAGAPLHAGTLGAFAPTRVLDTRSGLGVPSAGQVPAHATIVVTVTGVGGVTPVGGLAAVIANVTVTGASASGNLTVYPAGEAEPTTSNLNYPKTSSIPNLVLAGVGTGKYAGQIAITNNSAAAISVVADLSGYVLAADLPVPPASPGYYVRTLTGDSTHDASVTYSQGYDDGSAVTAADTAPRVVVLDFGAQTVHDPVTTGGVLLSTTQTRITYAAVVMAVRNYVNGWHDARGDSGVPGVPVTVVLATNSDGDWTGYPATNRANDWWTDVVHATQTSGIPSGFTVVGGSDIEAGFAATAAQVEQWITAYTAQADQPLVEIGSADACPDTPATVATTCQPVPSDDVAGTQTWSQEDYVQLAYGAAPGRIRVLPQIYTPGQAVQWENISLTAQHDDATPLTFLGSLTEFGADAQGSVSFDQGWANLYRQLSTSAVTAASPAAATDLGVL